MCSATFVEILPHEVDFIEKVAACWIKFLPKSEDTPLDFKLFHRILDPKGTVYDFDTDTFRPAMPADRLFRHTKAPFHEWDAPTDVKLAVENFGEKLFRFYVQKGCSLDPRVESDDERLPRKTIKGDLKREGALRCLRGPRVERDIKVN